MTCAAVVVAVIILSLFTRHVMTSLEHIQAAVSAAVTSMNGAADQIKALAASQTPSDAAALDAAATALQTSAAALDAAVAASKPAPAAPAPVAPPAT